MIHQGWSTSLFQASQHASEPAFRACSTRPFRYGESPRDSDLGVRSELFADFLPLSLSRDQEPGHRASVAQHLFGSCFPFGLWRGRALNALEVKERKSRYVEPNCIPSLP